MGPKLKKFPAMSAAAERLDFSVIPLEEAGTAQPSRVLGPRHYLSPPARTSLSLREKAP